MNYYCEKTLPIGGALGCLTLVGTVG